MTWREELEEGIIMTWYRGYGMDERVRAFMNSMGRG